MDASLSSGIPGPSSSMLTLIKLPFSLILRSARIMIFVCGGLNDIALLIIFKNTWPNRPSEAETIKMDKGVDIANANDDSLDSESNESNQKNSTGF